MFENEDFDIDEDFLKDVGEKEKEYYSQVNCSESKISEPSPKRHKLENLNCDIDDICFEDEPDFARKPAKSMEISSNESEMETLSCPKDITEIFTAVQPPQVNKDIEKMRRQLALEILTRGASESINCSPLQQKLSLNTASSRILQKIDGQVSNKIFKKPGERLIKSPAKNFSTNSPKYRSAPRTTLVRKFPGPAGLLPDNHDMNLNHTNFMDRLEEHKTDLAERIDDSNISEFCSQNTEKLFSVGAWRSMLDDLPTDFLKNHEIANIKRWARNNCNSSESSRAIFMAGVIQMIDHSVENPRLILKDLSDSIEATMHRDIPLAHPNIFEPGVVILLRDVGLLGFQGSQSCPGLQFHVMIAPKNVLAVYNEKTRLFTNPRMGSIIDKTLPTSETPRICKSIENATTNVEDENLIFTDKSFEICNSQRDEVVNVQTRINDDVSKSSANSAKNFDDTEERSENIEIRPKKLGSIKSRLEQYRNKNVRSPSIPDTDNSIENDCDVDLRGKENSPFGTFGDDLMNSDNDTEDEILSQLDMDSIVGTHD